MNKTSLRSRSRRKKSKIKSKSVRQGTRLTKQRKLWEALYYRLQNIKPRTDGFINFPTGLNKISRLQTFTDYKRNVGFSDIKCNRYRQGILIIKAGSCRDPVADKLLAPEDPGRYKVFVKGFKNLYEYGVAISAGEVSKKEHMELYQVIRKQQRILENNLGRLTKITNHNMDVPILHFKFICYRDPKCGYTR